MKDDLNPVWNFDCQFPIDCVRLQVRDMHLVFELRDEDNLSTSDLIGSVTIDVMDALEKPEELIVEDHDVDDLE